MGGASQTQKPGLGHGMRQVGTIQGVRVQEHRHSVVERDAVLRRVGCCLPLVPLEY